MLELMINEAVIREEHLAPDTTLLNYIREHEGLTGTKEGCGSGDCGACTVVMVELDTLGELRFRQINACITLIHSLHGKQILTVEYLKRQEQLHPIEQVVVDKHGSQCGFCTPGFVMSLYALSKQKIKPENPLSYLGGNLCRCTGYGPLIEAAEAISSVEYWDPAQVCEAQSKQWLGEVEMAQALNYRRPTTREALRKAKQQLPGAALVAGGTDLTLEITQKLKQFGALIDVGYVDDLQGITQTTSGWRLGAGVPLADVHPFMAQYFPSCDELFERLGSLAIRHRATLGGSLGHASPIGDIAPLVMSLGGQVEVDDGVQKQLIDAADFITGYRQTQLTPEQWISGVHLPNLQDNQHHAIYKVSKRTEDDISTVVLGVNLTLGQDDEVLACILAAGGIAAKSERLVELEKLLVGERLTQSVIDRVKEAVPRVISPISDVRASASYRVMLIQNLFQRFFYQRSGIATRLESYELPILNQPCSAHV
jgi:xanthine dehydrogenase small subunit